MNTSIEIREIAPSDRQWAGAFLFGSTKVVSRLVLHQADQLPGFIAVHQGEPVALLTYSLRNGELEVVTLHESVASLACDQGRLLQF